MEGPSSFRDKLRFQVVPGKSNCKGQASFSTTVESEPRRQRLRITLATLMKPFPVEWEKQRQNGILNPWQVARCLASSRRAGHIDRCNRGIEMRLSWNEIRVRAHGFAEKWCDANYEKGETQT